jgi:hypothetical protein
LRDLASSTPSSSSIQTQLYSKSSSTRPVVNFSGYNSTIDITAIPGIVPGAIVVVSSEVMTFRVRADQCTAGVEYTFINRTNGNITFSPSESTGISNNGNLVLPLRYSGFASGNRSANFIGLGNATFYLQAE